MVLSAVIYRNVRHTTGKPPSMRLPSREVARLPEVDQVALAVGVTLIVLAFRVRGVRRREDAKARRREGAKAAG